jgi:hypothetical protein
VGNNSCLLGKHTLKNVHVDPVSAKTETVNAAGSVLNGTGLQDGSMILHMKQLPMKTTS